MYRFEYILQMIDQLKENQPSAWKESIYSMLSEDIEKWISLETCESKNGSTSNGCFLDSVTSTAPIILSCMKEFGILI